MQLKSDPNSRRVRGDHIELDDWNYIIETKDLRSYSSISFLQNSYTRFQLGSNRVTCSLWKWTYFVSVLATVLAPRDMRFNLWGSGQTVLADYAFSTEDLTLISGSTVRYVLFFLPLLSNPSPGNFLVILRYFANKLHRCCFHIS